MGVFAAAVAVMALTGGCAVNPISSQLNAKHETTAQRDLLAEAAREVEKAPWPKPEPVSFVSRMTVGAIDSGFSKADAAETYAAALQPEGARFSLLEADAEANLAAANRLLGIAENAVFAPRLSGNDISIVEDAIQAQIEKLGEPVADDRVDAIRDAYNLAIRDLGEAADALADRLDRDQSENYASPAKPRVHNLSGV